MIFFAFPQIIFIGWHRQRIAWAYFNNKSTLDSFLFLNSWRKIKPAGSLVCLLCRANQYAIAHHNFFIDTIAACEAAWADAGAPELMQPWLDRCRCEDCGSSLLRPSQDDIEEGASVENQDDTFRYVCVACGYSDLIGPLMVKELNDAYDYDPRDGGEADIEECNACGRSTFVISDQHCLWCGAELDYPECSLCEEPLRQEDQANGGLCGYHLHVYEKVMRDD